MCCLAGGWWGIIVILLNKRSPHMKKKIQMLFTLTASFFLRLTSASASTISTIPLPSTAPGFSPSSHRGKEYAANGNGQRASWQYWQASFSIQTTISSTPAPSPESHCRPAPRTRWAASQFHVAAPVKRPHSSPAPHRASAGMLTIINPRADDGCIGV